MLQAIHRATRGLFLAIERVFNRVVGDRANPLYHLGSTSFLLFWVVIASGFYVYAFYRTGVETTYASVESFTHDQWFAGGIMRSLHRYASDAMVITMTLHLLRHFAFDRYRGFRAFSWLTGVVAAGLVIASGINGYMLPWDELAQYVLTATAEWFDALPVFGGVLVRNFLSPEAINDRFFSLLSFLHIGLPLALLALLWVHVQRVPKAATLPPRPITIATLGALVMLALVRPAISHGPAHLERIPLEVALDWFYLAALPAASNWPPLLVWGAAGAATLLLFALPWLPPRKAETHSITLRPDGVAITARRGETILEAGLRAGIALPYECRNGGCGKCKARLVRGTVDHGLYQRAALADDERAAGTILLCTSAPESDIVVEYAAAAERKVLTATVERLERVAPEVMLVMLALDAPVTYGAGQFINVVLEDDARRSYSFSTAGGTATRVELHVRRIPDGRFTTRVFETLKPGDALRFTGPHGHAPIEDADRPLIIVAGATGFAPAKSIIEDAFARGFRRRLILYWGVRRPEDLYMHALAESWTRAHPNFTYVPVLSEARSEDEWRGRTGLVHEAILADYPDLSGHDLYVCGSVRMVQAARPAFLAHGLAPDACFTDAFVPAA